MGDRIVPLGNSPLWIWAISAAKIMYIKNPQELIKIFCGFALPMTKFVRGYYFTVMVTFV